MPAGNKRPTNLPTRSQLQAAAFGLAPRTPEWLRAGPVVPAQASKSPPPSADRTWVVAAGRSDGWQLGRVAKLFARHGIVSEVDSRAGLLRVHRRSLRAACNLLRVHRRDLRLSRAAAERKIVDLVFLGLVGPPLLFSTVTLVLLMVLVSDADGPHPLLAAAAFASLTLSVFFIVRAVSAGLYWLANRSSGIDAVRLRRDGVDCPPAP